MMHFNGFLKAVRALYDFEMISSLMRITGRLIKLILKEMQSLRKFRLCPSREGRELLDTVAQLIYLNKHKSWIPEVFLPFA